MNTEQKLDDMDLAVLVCYRNNHITKGLDTEQGVMAHTLDKILPVIFEIKRESSERCN